MDWNEKEILSRLADMDLGEPDEKEFKEIRNSVLSRWYSGVKKSGIKPSAWLGTAAAAAAAVIIALTIHPTYKLQKDMLNKNLSELIEPLPYFRAEYLEVEDILPEEEAETLAGYDTDESQYIENYLPEDDLYYLPSEEFFEGDDVSILKNNLKERRNS